MARRLCCLVVAEGPDPTGAVASSVAFHGAAAAASPAGAGSCGVALSCSGVRLGRGGGNHGNGSSNDTLVAAPLSLLSPFLLARGGPGALAAAIGSSSSSSSRYGGAGGGGAPAAAPLLPMLPPPGVSLRVLLPPDEDEGEGENDANNSSSSGKTSSIGRWEAAQVAGVARLPACASSLRAALSRLRGAAEQPAARWRLGWALGGGNSNASDDEDAADEAATFLVLRIRGGAGAKGKAKAPPPLCRCRPHAPSLSSSLLPPASPVVAWGAPFGALAPSHFAGSAVAGVVSGSLPPNAAVLRLDLAALPGMEGGPVACGACGALAAVLSRPLARFSVAGGAAASGAVEVPLAFSAQLLMEACLPPAGGVGGGGGGGTAAAWDDEEGGARGAAGAGAAAPAAAPAPAAAVERALSRGVVMVRCGGAWATGVVMPRAPSSSGPVLVLTIAHLFDQAASAAATGAAASASPPAPPPLTCVRVTCPRTGRHAWSAPATLLHRFRSPHLDLAVLAVPYTEEGQGEQRAGLDALAPLELLSSPDGDSSAAALAPPPLPVVVAGHGLFGPAVGWPAAATAGTLARVVVAAASNAAAASAATTAPPTPTMALTTAPVHAGVSGGAVLCARSGRLAALVTSNSRHVSPAAAALASVAAATSTTTTTTLPRWNYAVPAEALRPLWAWAEREAAGAAGRAPFDARGRRARAALRAMDEAALQEGGEAAARVWALLPPASADGAGADVGRHVRARL